MTRVSLPCGCSPSEPSALKGKLDGELRAFRNVRRFVLQGARKRLGPKFVRNHDREQNHTKGVTVVVDTPLSRGLW